MKSNKVRVELIGTVGTATITKTNDKHHGKIINETKNTIVMETTNGEKRLFKRDITLTTNSKTIHGEQIRGRPEERIKR